MTRVVQYDEVGGPEVLRIREVQTPDPGEGKVTVRVRAAGINPFDAKMRSGFFPVETPFPRRLGSDLAGTVTAVGVGATYWDGTPVAVGDEVLGHGAGALAEQVVVRAENLTRRPEGLSIEAAGSLHVPGLTAVSVLHTVSVGAGDTVLVGGGSGAVGFLVAQLAAATGAQVIATANPRNHEMLRSAGVIPVAYGEGLADRVRELGQVTAVYDCHGREALDAGVVLGVPVDRMAAIAAYAAIEELGVLNVERGSRTTQNLASIAEQVADGSLVFPIAQTFPLDSVVEAFQALETSHAPGKIVVTP